MAWLLCRSTVLSSLSIIYSFLSLIRNVLCCRLSYISVQSTSKWRLPLYVGLYSLLFVNVGLFVFPCIFKKTHLISAVFIPQPRLLLFDMQGGSFIKVVHMVSPSPWSAFPLSVSFLFFSFFFPPDFLFFFSNSFFLGFLRFYEHQKDCVQKSEPKMNKAGYTAELSRVIGQEQ